MPEPPRPPRFLPVPPPAPKTRTGQLPDTPAVEPPPVLAPPAARPPVVAPPPVAAPAPAVVPTASVERAKAKESFESDEPLPAFTFPAIDEATKQELIASVEATTEAKPQSSLERAKAKESFEPDEPLPAFTYPAIDEATKQALIASVETALAEQRPPPDVARAATEVAPLPPVAALPPVAPPQPLEPQLRSSSAPRFDAAKALSEIQNVARDLWARASVLARQWIERACAFIDRNRSELPARVREPLSKVSARVILAVFAGLVLLVFLSLLAAIGGRHAEAPVVASADSVPAPPPPPKEDPVPHEIEQAKKDGHSALEKLAEKFPNDSRVWLALAASSSEKGDLAAAVSGVGKALALDPKAAEESTPSEVLAAAARKRATVDAAFALLQDQMGSAGATVLYDLSIDPGVAIPLRQRAEQWLKSDAFKKVAPPDVEIAAALRYSTSCSARHDVLPRAAEKGDKRTLAFLNVIKVPGGCGRRANKDCFPCLRKDTALKDAIAAIEQRASGR